MQHEIGDHALLADGRTAALIDPDGDVAWLPWPRVDSDPLLLSIIDEADGGTFLVRPAHPEARVVSRRYRPGTLVLETVWKLGASRLVVEDALLLGSAPRLLRRVRSLGGEVQVLVRFRHREPSRGVEVVLSGERLHSGSSRVLTARDAPLMMQLAATGTPAALEPALDATIAAWRRESPQPHALHLDELAAAVPESELRAVLVTSACVLLGLQSTEGGIVAAPTTSLPQWPGTSRTWDYRYCWLRDGALAATALLRAGCADRAYSLADFLGSVAQSEPPRALVRVDGTVPPVERTLDALSGYRGARPVRVGNAAAEQRQLDVGGELTQLARVLAGLDALPKSLAGACVRIADWTAEHWLEPDHGIWEIRGPARRYTHSRVMAWVALRDAVQLADSGVIAGSSSAWRRAAMQVHEHVLSAPAGALQLTDAGGGADAALSCVPLVAFLPPTHRTVRATLDLIRHELDRSGLLDRHRAEQDISQEPCGPFVFPTFWMASALAAAGASGKRYFSAAAASRGALDLFGETADPVRRGPLGNFPQVQSHAALVLAATADQPPR